MIERKKSDRVSKASPPTTPLPSGPVQSGIPTDWIRADLRGEDRTLEWYVDRAEKGDQRAALRALQLCERSLSLKSLRQNGMRIDFKLADALRRILGDRSEDGQLHNLGDGRVLKAARGKPGTRGGIEGAASARWWLCYDMHRTLRANPSMTQDEAAELVLNEPDVIFKIQADSLARIYRDLLPEINAEFANQDAEVAEVKTETAKVDGEADL